MLQEKLDNKINKLLGLKENIDIAPTISVQVPEVLPSVQVSEQPQIDVVALINKQTEMIVAMIQEQNRIIEKLADILSKNFNVPNLKPSEFKEKIIDLNFDSKGNPIGATIRLKPDTTEDDLDLDELEQSKHLVINDIEIPK